MYVLNALVGDFYRYSSIFLSSRSRTGLATAYSILLGMVEARLVNVN